MTSKKQILIYTDGGCLGNPGPGGYGVVLKYQDKVKTLSGGYALTTNNRMELMACIEGLKSIKYPCQITLYSDSKYVVDAIMKGWAKKWQANNWMRNRKDPAVNIDLWQILLKLIDQHTIEFKWVKGHSGHPENELCDQLAKKAASQRNLPADENYIKS